MGMIRIKWLRNKIEKYILYINDSNDEITIKVNNLNGGK